MQRRAFFGAVFSGLGSAASAKAQNPKAGGIPMRTLGKTGQKLTIIGMGGARFHLAPSFEEGAAIVGCPESTARSRMDYGLEFLRKKCRRRDDKKSSERIDNETPP